MFKARFVISTIYLIAVVVCVFMAFDFRGAINDVWTLILFLLTLPGSFLTVPFLWALFHGAGLEFFAFIYFMSAILNVLFVNWLISRQKRANDSKIDFE